MVVLPVLKAAGCTRCERPGRLRVFGAEPQLRLVQRSRWGRFSVLRSTG